MTLAGLQLEHWLHGPLPAPFLVSYSAFIFIFPYFFSFLGRALIKLAISSAYQRTLIYRIVSYRIVS